MKNKTKIAFLTTIVSLGMVLAACGGSSNKGSSSNEPLPGSSSMPTASSSEAESSSSIAPESSSTQKPSSSSVAPSSSSSAQPSSSSSNKSSSSSTVSGKHRVTFIVDGTVVDTFEVNDGDVAVYNGEKPTKAQSGSTAYRFKGWDNDLDKPITADTTFTAVFEAVEYADVVMVDDFENFSGTASLKDAGWNAWYYDSGTNAWTTETKASVSIGYNSVEGQKSLRFDAWENGIGYKFVKTLKDGAFTKSANALRFRLMVPKMNKVRVLLKGKLTIGGKEQAPSFSYDIYPTSNEFVEYTIPLADNGWALWDDPTKTIKVMADWMGIHEDDYLRYLTSIDFFVQGDDKPYGGNGYSYQAYLDSVKFVTLDNPQNTEEETMKSYTRYTGKLADDTTVRIDLGANGQATAKLIDLEVPQTIPGTYAINEKEITFTSMDNGGTLVYKGKLVDGGTVVNYVSSSGAYANAVRDMNLTAVQVVEDFESYTENGVSYSQQNFDEEAASGARGAYYGEYYAGDGRADWGGSGWQILKDGDEVNLITDANNVHSGSKSLSLKHMKNNAIRYMQWDLYKGHGETRNFRGSKMGLWVKGYVDKLSVYAFSDSTPTATELSSNSGFKKDDYNIDANANEWIHIELDLNPILTYHGFMIKIEKDYAKDSQLYIDDVEIYDANPYATYQAPEVKKMIPGMTYIAKALNYLQIRLDIVNATDAKLSVPAENNDSITGTYVFDEKEITISFEDNNTYVATVSEDLKDLTFKSVSGGNISRILNNTSFKMIDYADNAETYEKDGNMYYQSNTNQNNRSGARGAYYCEYTWSSSSPVCGAGWGLMGGAGDQLKLDTVNSYDGTKSLSMKKSSAGKMRYMEWGLFDGTALGHTGVTKFAIYMKNPLSSQTKLTLMLYKVQKVQTSNNTEENRIELPITMEANQDWKKYVISLNANETYYGYAIVADKDSNTGYFNVDYAHYYNVDNNPELPFYAYEGLELNGEAYGTNAAIVFEQGGSFFVRSASVPNIPGTYDLEMVNGHMILTLTISDTIFKGTYISDISGKVTFTVTEASGSNAGMVKIGAIFAN